MTKKDRATATANVDPWFEIQMDIVRISKLGRLTIERDPTSALVRIVYQHHLDRPDSKEQDKPYLVTGPEEKLKDILAEVYRMAKVLERLA